MLMIAVWDGDSFRTVTKTPDRSPRIRLLSEAIGSRQQSTVSNPLAHGCETPWNAPFRQRGRENARDPHRARRSTAAA